MHTLLTSLLQCWYFLESDLKYHLDDQIVCLQFRVADGALLHSGTNMSKISKTIYAFIICKLHM